MARYDDLRESATPLLSNLEHLSPEAVLQLRNEHPAVPDDFLDFLSEIGAGELGDGVLMIYNGLVQPQDVYGPDAAESLKEYLLLGDDMQGYCIGFRTADWNIVEIAPDWSTDSLGGSFERFIRDKCAEAMTA